MKAKTKKLKNFGFTLVELLVVISIISLLSTIVLNSLQLARSKARDSYRMSSIKQLSNALELFYSTYNRYPTTGSAQWQYSCNGTGTGNWITDSTYPTWSSTYISAQAHDPQETGCTVNTAPQTVPLGTPVGYGYYSDASGSVFGLAARLENDTKYDVGSTCQKWMILVGGIYPTLYNGAPCNGTMNWNATTYFVNNTYK